MVEQAIKVMQAFTMGKEVESTIYGKNEWEPDVAPTWDWSKYEYRVKPDKLKRFRTFLDSNEIYSSTITFGCARNWNEDVEKKILYDTHIREAMKHCLEIDDTAKFTLVPIDKNAEKIIERIIDVNKARKKAKFNED